MVDLLGKAIDIGLFGFIIYTLYSKVGIIKNFVDKHLLDKNG